MMLKQYRIIESLGQYFNRRYELQEKYYYYTEDGEKILTWHMIFHSSDKNKCAEALKRRKTEKRKIKRIPFDANMWN